MKKAFSLIAIMSVILMTLTGCVDVNYEVTINKDGSADVSYLYGIKKEELEKTGKTSEEMTKEMKNNAEKSNYEIEIYSDDKIEGFKAKKHLEDVSKASLAEAFGTYYITDKEENQIKVEKNGIKVKYSQNAKIDLSNIESSKIAMKYTVKIPAKVGKNNADEVSKDEKTLTWNLKAGEINEINFEATSNNIGIVIAILATILVIIVTVIVIIIVLKKVKKEKTKNEDIIVEVLNKEKNKKKEE